MNASGNSGRNSHSLLTLWMASAWFRLQLTSHINDHYTKICTMNVVPIRSFRASNSIPLFEYYRPDHVDSVWQFDISNHVRAVPYLLSNRCHAMPLDLNKLMQSYSLVPIVRPDAVLPIRLWIGSDVLLNEMKHMCRKWNELHANYTASWNVNGVFVLTTKWILLSSC